jgi:hypothetical protein
LPAGHEVLGISRSLEAPSAYLAYRWGEPLESSDLERFAFAALDLNHDWKRAREELDWRPPHYTARRHQRDNRLGESVLGFSPECPAGIRSQTMTSPPPGKLIDFESARRFFDDLRRSKRELSSAMEPLIFFIPDT